MFLSGYVLLIFVAAPPLVRTILRGRGGVPPIVFPHRLCRDFAYIAVVVLAIIALEMALTISLQNYWFGELDQTHRYWLALGLRVAIFLSALLSVGVFVGYNLHRLCRHFLAVPRSAPWFAAFIFAAFLGLGATPGWVLLMGFLGAAPSGTRDPVFDKDPSFYLLAPAVV